MPAIAAFHDTDRAPNQPNSCIGSRWHARHDPARPVDGACNGPDTPYACTRKRVDGMWPCLLTMTCHASRGSA